MGGDNIPKKTLFAPAGRASDIELDKQSSLFSDDSIFAHLLDFVPMPVAILNAQRQVVYHNRALAAFENATDSPLLIGLRPGEVFDCEHAQDQPEGCGTTEFCRTCGAVQAILAAQQGRDTLKECRIVRQNHDPLDLRVWASPFAYKNKEFTFVSLLDISNEKRRNVLERVFFHDILNLAGGIKGYANLMPLVDEQERVEFAASIRRISDELVNEVQAQRDLTSAESGLLPVRLTDLYATEVLREVLRMFEHHEVADKAELSIAEAPEAVSLRTDTMLLLRVMGNMIKNSLEATHGKGPVVLSSYKDGDHVVFTVNNPGTLPREVQLQIFQRSFSTKGQDRGLGTYSMRLLGERYLGGKVWFSSSQDSGTTFFVSLPREGPPLRD